MEKIFYFKWEEQLIIWLQSLGGGGPVSKILDFLNNMFSFMGEEMFAVAVLGAVYWGLDKKRGERIGFAIISSMVVNNMIKNLVKRLRPFKCSDQIVLKREVGDYSFPSAHSSSAASMYPTLAAEYKEKKWLRIPAVLFPLLIGTSRFYLGAHWPTDVMAGLGLGVVVFLAVEFLAPRVKKIALVYGVVLLVGAAGMFFCETEDYFSSYGLLFGFCAAMLFERKYVNFENTKKWYFVVLRTAFGAVIFLGMNTLLKAVIGLIPIEAELGLHLLRFVRYCLAAFVVIGVYPLSFKTVEGFLGKKFSK